MKIDHEFLTAEKSRIEGNEGKARVCARRAVGFAIQAKLHSHGINVKAPDLQTLTKIFLEEIETPEKLKEIIDHMSLKVNHKVDSKSTFWPYPEIDLIEEAKYFVENILSN